MRDYSALSNQEIDAEIAARVYRETIIWDEFIFNGERHRYPLIKMPSINSKSVPQYTENYYLAIELLDWLTEREGEVWISKHRFYRDSESGDLVSHEKPYPVIVTLPEVFWSTPELPFARAICVAVLTWLDMDEDLKWLEREGR